MPPPRPPVAAALRSLAPLHLPNLRPTRYLGDDQFAAMEAMVPDDQQRMRQLYEDLNDLLSPLSATDTVDAVKRRAVEGWMAHGRLDALIKSVHALGQATTAAGTMSEALIRTLHDVRGGALGALVARLSMLDEWPGPLGEKLSTLFFLVRDHLKIMRNSIVGLDDARREADRAPQSHSAALLVEKWHDVVVGPSVDPATVRMQLDCRYDGTVTECCLEAGAMDRMFYNLANNARRHTSDGSMEMVVFEVPEVPGANLRFVLSNAVNPDQARALRRMAVGRSESLPATRLDPSPTLRLDALFSPAVSSTGSGYGLAVVAEFVAHAFGLPNAFEAVREGYVGAVLEGSETFRVWFHWPVGSAVGQPALARSVTVEHGVGDYHLRVS